MEMTIAEKILAEHSGRNLVSPGEFLQCKLDVVLANDVSGVLALPEMEKMGYQDVFDPKKVVLVNDHYAPNSNISAAQNCKALKEFANKTGVENFYDVGTMGIEHALLPEEGLTVPGELIIGGDSHTCTYGALGAFSTGVGSTDIAVCMAKGELWLKVPESLKFIFNGTLPEYITGKDLILYTIGQIGVDGALYKAMEFEGSAISQLSIDERFSMCNMAIEAGGKTGIICADEKTEEYVKKHTQKPYKVYHSDPGASYEKVYEFDVSRMEPQVAFPHLPSNTKNVSEVGDIPIEQVVIGSCTNGRLEDLRQAAKILKDHKVAPQVKTIIIPATQKAYHEALKEGLIDIFIQAQAAVSMPTCGPCFGGHTGLLAEGERCVSTTNRNFKGRMGHPESEVYLASPIVAAASAVTGKISSPGEVV